MSAIDSQSDVRDRFDDFAVGQSAERIHTVLDADIAAFAAVTGDSNPVHLDETAAIAAGFEGRIAHGMLAAGYISATMAMALPGPGAIYLTQSLRFVRPVRMGDVVTTRVEILEIFRTRRRLRMSTVCVNTEGKTVVDGEAAIMIPKPRA